MNALLRRRAMMGGVSLMKIPNLLEDAELHPGYYTTGGAISGQQIGNERYTNLIPVSGGDVVTLILQYPVVQQGWAAIAQFTAEKVFLTRDTTLAAQDFSSFAWSTKLREDCAYIGVSFRSYNDVNVIFNKADVIAAALIGYREVT